MCLSGVSLRCVLPACHLRGIVLGHLRVGDSSFTPWCRWHVLAFPASKLAVFALECISNLWGEALDCEYHVSHQILTCWSLHLRMASSLSASSRLVSISPLACFFIHVFVYIRMASWILLYSIGHNSLLSFLFCCLNCPRF